MAEERPDDGLRGKIDRLLDQARLKERLDMLASTANGMVGARFETPEAPWVFDEGKGNSKEPNMRLYMDDPDHAERFARALNVAGIPAQTARKGQRQMVRIMASDFHTASPKNVDRASINLGVMPDLSYASMDYAASQREGAWLQAPGGQMFASNGSFYQVTAPQPPDAKETGWKVHLTVDKDQVAQAWNLAQPIFEQYGVTAKAVSPRVAEKFGIDHPTYFQSGKMLTVYDNGRSPDQWQEMLGRIEKRFAEAGIKPGPAVKGEPMVAGSQYAHYRNDLGLDGDYARPRFVGDYNPAERPELFDKVRLGVSGPSATASATHPDGAPIVAGPHPVIAKLNRAMPPQIDDRQWEYEPGAGGVGVPNARISFDDPAQAYRYSMALDRAGIQTERYTKGAQQMLVLKEPQFGQVTPEAAAAVRGHYEPLAEQAGLAHLNRATTGIPGVTSWDMNDGSGSYGQRHARLTLGDGYQAQAISDALKEAGIPAKTATKGASSLVIVDSAAMDHLNRDSVSDVRSSLEAMTIAPPIADQVAGRGNEGPQRPRPGP